MPHVPLFVSDRFKGKSTGLYGDVIEEIDWSVGQILDAVSRAKLDEHTLVIFTSDNGPWMSYGNHARIAGPFREGKGTSFDGGVRVPFVARWPGRIPGGSVSHAPGDDHRSAADAREARRAPLPATHRRRPRPVAGPLAAARRLGRRTTRCTSTGAPSCTRFGAAAGSCTCRTPISRSSWRARTVSPASTFEKSSGCRCSTSTPIRVNRPTSPSVIRTS